MAHKFSVGDQVELTIIWMENGIPVEGRRGVVTEVWTNSKDFPYTIRLEGTHDDVFSFQEDELRKVDAG